MEKLELGQLLFPLPQQWEEERSETVRLSVFVNAKESVRTLEEELEISAEAIPVSEVMSAHLSGTSFDIEAVTNERQVVTSGETTWSWNVTPMEPGDQTLQLVVSAHLDAGPLGQAAKIFPVYERDVRVRDVKENLSARTLSMIRENVPLMGALAAVVAVVFAALTYKRGGRKGEDEGARSDKE